MGTRKITLEEIRNNNKAAKLPTFEQFIHESKVLENGDLDSMIFTVMNSLDNGYFEIAYPDTDKQHDRLKKGAETTDAIQKILKDNDFASGKAAVAKVKAGINKQLK